MRQPIHAIGGGRKEMTPERIMGIGFVAVLHVIVIWAILTGLVQKAVRQVVPKDITIIDVAKPKEPLPPMKKPEFKQPDLTPTTVLLVPPPDFVIQDDGSHAPPGQPRPQQQPDQQVSIPDVGAVSVTGTHTTPAYPMLERRLNHQGTVELRLSISPQGAVVAADIVKSSGFPTLDQAAVGWVLQHWKYKPAIRGGMPVASETIAAVVFSLRNAG